jgi:hypothetical protein
MVALVVVALVVVPPSPAAAATTVTTFDLAKGEPPEGIVFDRGGLLYVSLAPLGEIRRRSADGSWSAFASIGPDPAVVFRIDATHHEADDLVSAPDGQRFH